MPFILPKNKVREDAEGIRIEASEKSEVVLSKDENFCISSDKKTYCIERDLESEPDSEPDYDPSEMGDSEREDELKEEPPKKVVKELT